MRIFAVYNIKGGVGKTAAAVNLAYLSALAGARTLVWDLDPQGAATFYFRVRPKVKGGGKKLLCGDRALNRLVKGTDFDRLDLLPADFSYRKLDHVLDDLADPTARLASLLQPLSKSYDNIFLDSAPGISLTSESVFVAADALLVPTVPTTLSMRTLKLLRRHLRRRGPERLRVLPFFSMVDVRKKLHRQISGLAAEPESDFLASWIPYASLVEQMGSRRQPLLAYAAASVAAQRYRQLWTEVDSKVAD